MRVRRIGCTLIDATRGQVRELLVGRFFFIQGPLQKLGGLGMPHRLRPGDQGPVGRHLVVLGALTCGNQACIHRGVIEVLFHDRLALFDDAGDAVAMLATDFFVQVLEHLLEPFDLSLRLLQMSLERLPQLGVE